MTLPGLVLTTPAGLIVRVEGEDVRAGKPNRAPRVTGTWREGYWWDPPTGPAEDVHDVEAAILGAAAEAEAEARRAHGAVIAALCIPGRPGTQRRARAVGISFGKRVSARVYTDKVTATERSHAHACALAAWGPPGVAWGAEGALRVEIEAVYERPRRVPTWRVAKPDADNLAKLVLDAITPWTGDDSCVSELVVRKVWSQAASRTLVRVSLLPRHPPRPMDETP